jgi:hypothetical protein
MRMKKGEGKKRKKVNFMLQIQNLNKTKMQNTR